MQKIKTVAAVLLGAVAAGNVLCAVPAQRAEAAGTPVNVWLIGGQSNAVGYAQDAPSDADLRYTQGFDNVLFYGKYETDTNSCPSEFVPVKLGQGKCWSGGTKGSGAEIGIASALGDSKELNAVIKCAWGATFLYPDRNASVSVSRGTWTSPSYRESSGISGGMVGKMYDDFIQTVQTGLSELEAKGYVPAVRGMWWMQGEAESQNAAYANAYADCLTAFISDVRSDLSELTECDLSEMPFVLGKIYRNPAPQYPQHAHVEIVRAAQQQVADSVAGVFAVDCSGLAQHDGWHFKADAQKYLGEQFVSAVLAAEGTRKVTVNAANASVSGAGIKQAGQTVLLKPEAKRGYKITGVSAAAAGGAVIALKEENGRYSFVMPDANVTVTVTTEALPLYRLISATVNDSEMGSVFPSAEAKNGWYEGESVQIAVQPKEGCSVSRVTVNGREIAPFGERGGLFIYTVSDCADVAFAAEFTKETGNVSPGGQEQDGSGTENASGCGAAGGACLAAVAAAAVLLLRKNRK